MADAAMMRTVSNLTRRRTAGRLQVGIDRYVPSSRQDGRTSTRSVTKSPGPRLPAGPCEYLPECAHWDLLLAVSAALCAVSTRMQRQLEKRLTTLNVF